jgi:hypothetical protein
MKVSDKEKIALVDDIEEALANSRDLKKKVDTLTKEQFEANKQQDYLKNENNDLKNNIIMLENGVKSRDLKIAKLKEELSSFESVPSTSKCGECDYGSDDEIELETHMKSNHVDQTSQDGKNHMETNLLFKCDICAFKTRKFEDLSKHTQGEHQKRCIHCDFTTQSKESLNLHMKENHKLTCGKCQLTSKDEWKHNIHVCKVHINNPIHEQFYTKDWLDHNGCNKIYSAELNEEVIILHSDKCWTNELPCYWIPHNLKGKPSQPGDVRHFEFNQFIMNENMCWSALMEKL